MKKLTTLISSVTSAVGTLTLMPFVAMAQSQNPLQQAQDYTDDIRENANIGERSLPQIVGDIINITLGFLGIVLLALILYAGFLWMTAGGNEEKVKEARQIIVNSVIGLIIVIAAFAISSFVLGSLVNISQ